MTATALTKRERVEEIRDRLATIEERKPELDALMEAARARRGEIGARGGDLSDVRAEIAALIAEAEEIEDIETVLRKELVTAEEELRDETVQAAKAEHEDARAQLRTARDEAETEIAAWFATVGADLLGRLQEMTRRVIEAEKELVRIGERRHSQTSSVEYTRGVISLAELLASMAKVEPLGSGEMEAREGRHLMDVSKAYDS